MVSAFTCWFLIHNHQRFHHELRHQVEHLLRFNRIAAANGFSRLEGPASRKYGESPEENTFWIGEQIPTPIYRSLQGLLACQPCAAVACQQFEALIKTCGDLFHGKRVDASRGQFNCQWNAIQAVAYLSNDRRAFLS